MGLVKLCGMTRVSDAQKAAEAEADVIGIVVDFPPSPRSMSVDHAVGLAQRAAKPYVGVVVEPSLDLIASLVRRYSPVALQLSGRESMAVVADVKRAHPGLAIWKTLHLSAIAPEEEVGRLVTLAASFMGAGADAFVLDAKHPTLPGGTGLTPDWAAAHHLVSEIGAPVILAGGLSPANVAEAIRSVRPAGVDASSGVEKSPGVKDPGAMNRFTRRARSAFLEIGENPFEWQSAPEE